MRVVVWVTIEAKVLTKVSNVCACLVVKYSGVGTLLSLQKAKAICCVIVLVTEAPRKFFVSSEASKKKVKRVSHDDCVVKVDDCWNSDHSIAHAS